jgi:hypothetical protein
MTTYGHWKKNLKVMGDFKGILLESIKTKAALYLV